MTHASTVASSIGRYSKPFRDAPREGTKIRALYDLFVANPGKAVQISIGGANYTRLEYLRDSYGLDIRRLRKGYWVLVGEWVGKAYVDFLG
jgi:hypothetical protein